RLGLTPGQGDAGLPPVGGKGAVCALAKKNPAPPPQQSSRHQLAGVPGSLRIMWASAPFSAESVALQADGKIVIAGRDASNFMVARYSAVNGSPDVSFGNNGIAAWPVAAYDTADVALEPDGRIVVAGTTLNASHDGIFAAARFLAA